VTEHLADTLDGHTVRHGHRCGKRMSGDVKRELLVDFAADGQLFQAGVHSLIGGNWKHRVIIAQAFEVAVLVQYIIWYLQQRDVRFHSRLLAFGANPETAIHTLDFPATQVLNVNVREPGEAGEHKEVADSVHVFHRRLVSDESVQFGLVEILPVNNLQFEIQSDKGITLHPAVPEADIDDLLEELHELDGRVVGTVAVRFQVGGETGHKVIVHGLDRNIIGFVLQPDESLQVFKTGTVFLAGSAGSFLADQFGHFSEVFLPERHEHIGLGGVHAHDCVAQHFGRDQVMCAGELVELLSGLDQDGIYVLVEYPALDGFGRGTALGGVPQVRVDRAVELQGQSAALNVDFEQKRAFAVLLGSRLAKEEDERKGCFSG